MLRPTDVLEWFKVRTGRHQNELAQLVDGVLPGGQIVIGGAEGNVQKMLPMLAARHRVGRLVSIAHAQLHVDMPTTFDTAAILQLLMTQKNETFHQTIDQAVTLITQVLNDGHDASVALQILQEQANEVPRL